MNSESRRKLLWVSLFAIGFGWVESSVVVYLRLLYYPEGFAFPVKVIPWSVGWIELIREAATILMLLAVGMLTGRTKLERFGWFMFGFGVWDIVYYVGLKLSIGWSSSLLTWDLLFLLPLPWIGPVIAPVLVSLAMIAACIVIVIMQDRGTPIITTTSYWVIEIICGLIIIFSFIIDYQTAFTAGDPDRFRWEIFLTGYLIGIGAFVRLFVISKRDSSPDRLGSDNL